MSPPDNAPPPPAEEPIPAGRARAAALAALANLAHASGEVAALLEAYARALDVQSGKAAP